MIAGVCMFSNVEGTRSTNGRLHILASILIYRSTKLENKQKLEFESALSTCPISKAAISVPRSFTYLSILTGVINTFGALLRFQQIHFLEIPSIPWLAVLFPIANGRAYELPEPVLKAQVVVALNDWTSLFMCLTFLAAGLFNFATVRQLRLRDQWVKRVLLPIVTTSQHGWCEVIEEKKDVVEMPRGQVESGHGEPPNLDGFMEEELQRPPAVFAPLCARRSG
ncbi:hypothetical protein BJ912DRAFT_987221 [Pholiota molesta]|nr:hypothetical protein BJ912DRAFT_987221 [Pholiota molesta]